VSREGWGSNSSEGREEKFWTPKSRERKQHENEYFGANTTYISSLRKYQTTPCLNRAQTYVNR